MRKNMKWIPMVLAVTVLSGCASSSAIQKKFTRKAKEPAHKAATIYIEEQGPYQKKFSNEYYYKSHFTLWKTWHSDLMDQLGGNSKKVTRCAQEALGHLTEMNRYLNPQKQSELAEVLGEFSQIEQMIERGPVSDTQIGTMRADLERIQRLIANNFYFDKVQASLVPEAVDLGSGSQ